MRPLCLAVLQALGTQPRLDGYISPPHRSPSGWRVEQETDEHEQWRSKRHTGPAGSKCGLRHNAGKEDGRRGGMVVRVPLSTEVQT